MSAALRALSDSVYAKVAETFGVGGTGSGRRCWYSREGVRVSVVATPNAPRVEVYGELPATFAACREWYIHSAPLRRARLLPPALLDRITVAGEVWEVLEVSGTCWRWAGVASETIVVLTKQVA